MSECTHDLADRETACADGMCPICLQVKVVELERDNAELDDDCKRAAAVNQDHEKRIESLQQQLAAALATCKALESENKNYREYLGVTVEDGLVTFRDIKADEQMLEQQLAAANERIAAIAKEAHQHNFVDVTTLQSALTVAQTERDAAIKRADETRAVLRAVHYELENGRNWGTGIFPAYAERAFIKLRDFLAADEHEEKGQAV